MNRIAATFARARAEGRCCFITYITACDPDPEMSLEVCRTLLENGADLIELGVPFSDPLADGLTNQLAAARALAAGGNLGQVLALVRKLRATTPAPIVLYVYCNMVMSPGVDHFVARAAAAGVDGLLVLDLPPEEAGELETACAAHGVATIRLVAPTTPEARLDTICKAASGFIYYVGHEGVTGERTALASNLGERIALIRRHTDLPVAVGFGISTAEHVRTVAAVADGAVVGSALVNCIARNLDARERILPALRAKMQELCAPISADRD
jgi:tryptophan synthase alpha chain